MTVTMTDEQHRKLLKLAEDIGKAMLPGDRNRTCVDLERNRVKARKHAKRVSEILYELDK